jgi:hypothetical protein
MAEFMQRTRRGMQMVSRIVAICEDGTEEVIFDATRAPKEWLGCSEGFVFRRDSRLPTQTVQLFNDSGELLATVPNVKELTLGALPREQTKVR